MESEPNRSQRPRLAGNTFLMVAMVIALVLLAVVVGVLALLLALDTNPFVSRTQAAVLSDGADTTVGTLLGLSPESTYTPLPTFTPPAAAATPVGTPVFPFNATEVLYLDSSIRKARFWNPATPTPFVPENDRIAILQLVKDEQAYHQSVWRYQEYSDLDRYNASYGLRQRQRYYDYYIDPDDGCYANIGIVDDQFQTTIIYYDGALARSMTSKVESREYICNGEQQQLVANDAYAYELLLQKFTNGSGAVYWRIIEHPLGSDPSQQ